MNDLLMFDLETTLREIIVRMEEEAAYDRDAYYDLVDETLEEKRESGELTDDNNIEELAEKLKIRWPEVEESLSTGHDQGILED